MHDLPPIMSGQTIADEMRLSAEYAERQEGRGIPQDRLDRIIARNTLPSLAIGALGVAGLAVSAVVVSGFNGIRTLLGNEEHLIKEPQKVPTE